MKQLFFALAVILFCTSARAQEPDGTVSPTPVPVFIETAEQQPTGLTAAMQTGARLLAAVQFNSSLRVFTPLATDPFTCATAYKGLAYFNTVSGAAKVCDGTAWTTVGGAGGVTCMGCTSGTLTKYTGSNLANSLISESGSTVTVNGDQVPNANGTRSLGSPTLEYGQAYLNRVIFNPPSSNLGDFAGYTAGTGPVFRDDTTGFITTLNVQSLTANRTITQPNAATFLPVYGTTITYTGPTAARTVTYPDANFTVARTDAAQTFTGIHTFTDGITLGTSGNLFGGTNLIEQRNGTNAQAYRFFKSYTDSSNGEWLGIMNGSFAGNEWSIATSQLGTGVSRALAIGTSGSSALRFLTAGNYRFQISSAGNLLAETDNTLNIGASGTGRPANMFLGTSITSPTYLTTTNCADSAGAAACGSAAAGAFVIDAGSTSVVVSTTAITANSQIFVQYDSSLGARLGITCNVSPAMPSVTARSAATSFTVSIPVAPVTNAACFSYHVLN